MERINNFYVNSNELLISFDIVMLSMSVLVEKALCLSFELPSFKELSSHTSLHVSETFIIRTSYKYQIANLLKSPIVCYILIGRWEIDHNQ